MLDREEASRAVAAGLCLSRLIPPRDVEIAHRAGPWILGTMAERLDLPPIGVVADLGALLFGASLDALRTNPAPTDDPALLAALRRYEDSVLGRLAVDSRLTTAGFAAARLPTPMHAQAVAILVAGVLSRIAYDGGVEVGPGVVRQLTERKPEEGLARGFDLLRTDEETRKLLTEGYASLARCAQKAKDLIGDADLFALENLTVLSSLTQRLAIADVVRAQESIATELPRRFPRKRKKEGDVASKLEDESIYPVGGFSSVSTSGSLENLVTSELIYMDPPAAGGKKADVDLFDMRYVEGELLYYTRDEAIFVRRRRLVVIALAPDLVRTRVKTKDLPWQRIVLVLGMVLTVTKKLFELLGEEALEIRVVFLHEKDEKPPLGDERQLAELMLREWRDKGMADVLDATWADVGILANAAARRSLVEVLRVGLTPLTAKQQLDQKIVTLDIAPPPGGVEAWSKLATEVLSALL